MIANVISRTTITDMEDSSVIKQILAATAREIDDANYQLTRLQDLFSIDRAAGADLDARAAELLPEGRTRIAAQRAIGYLVFSRPTTTGTVGIPVGTVVRAQTSGALFRTTQAGVITPTSAALIAGHAVGRDSNLVSAVAIEAGSLGNVDAGTVTRFLAGIPGVTEVVNLASFVRGRDAETDDEFRARIKQYLNSLYSCTVDALEFAAKQQVLVDGQAVVYAHAAEDPIRPGYVTLYIDDGTGTAETYVNDAPSGSLVGGSISAVSGTSQTLTIPTGPFTVDHVGRTITISGATTVANNGSFTVTAVLGSTQIVYTNTTGGAGAETPTVGTYALNGELLTDGLAGPPVNTTVGGEEYLDLRHAPVRIRGTNPFTVISTVGVTSTTLTQGTHYILNPASGRIHFLIPRGPAESIRVSYTYYTGLIDLVQRVIDGDPTDRLNFPGVRAAGTTVVVTTPEVVPLTVRVTLQTARGTNRSTINAAVESAISTYINELGISGDVIRNELIEQIMGVVGVVDCTLELPATNLVMNDNQLPRITVNDIDVL
jgi:uncharacterized phage protein gp47/JayE